MRAGPAHVPQVERVNTIVNVSVDVIPVNQVFVIVSTSLWLRRSYHFSAVITEYDPNEKVICIVSFVDMRVVWGLERSKRKGMWIAK